MKKLAGALTAVLMIAASAFFMSCDTDAHEHTFAETWTSDEDFHWHAATCEHTNEVSDKAAHTFEQWSVTTEATEDAAGEKTRECKVCGYKETEEIAKLGHTFAEEWESDKTNHWHKATCAHTNEVSDKAAHTFGEWKVTKAATTEAEGEKVRECSVCGYKETVVIEKHVHTYSESWSSDETNHWHAATCDDTTEVKDKAEHTLVDVTKEGITGKACSVCGYTTIKAAAVPVISVASDDSGLTVTITCKDSAAKIYYTTDGTDPTATSLEYTAPFAITTEREIKAIAKADGLTTSAAGTYTVTKVTYKSEYGTAPKTLIVNKGTALTKDALPALEPPANVISMDGWYIGDTKIEAGYKVTEDVTLTAKYTKEIVLFKNTADKTQYKAIELDKLKNHRDATLVVKTLTTNNQLMFGVKAMFETSFYETRYTHFGSWSSSDIVYDYKIFAFNVGELLDKAEASAKANNKTLEYISIYDWGSVTLDSIFLTKDVCDIGFNFNSKEITFNAPVGYTVPYNYPAYSLIDCTGFNVGDDTDSNWTSFKSTIDETKTSNVADENVCSVSFAAGEGAYVLDPIYVPKGSTFTASVREAGSNFTWNYNGDYHTVPENNIKGNQVVAGWYTDEGLTQFFTSGTITENTTLYPKYVKACTVTFDGNEINYKLPENTTAYMNYNFNSLSFIFQVPGYDSFTYDDTTVKYTYNSYNGLTWYTDSSYTTNVMGEENKLTLTDDIKLYGRMGPYEFVDSDKLDFSGFTNDSADYTLKYVITNNMSGNIKLRPYIALYKTVGQEWNSTNNYYDNKNGKQFLVYLDQTTISGNGTVQEYYFNFQKAIASLSTYLSNHSEAYVQIGVEYQTAEMGSASDGWEVYSGAIQDCKYFRKEVTFSDCEDSSHTFDWSLKNVKVAEDGTETVLNTESSTHSN